MVSRTSEGKHTKRFIIEYYSSYDGKYVRSVNGNHLQPFPTRKAARRELTPASTADGFKYRIRQK
jgi:hypothetical protein